MYTSPTTNNWAALTESQRDYFRHLSADTPLSATQFFEQSVPVELQDDPEKLEVFLNGGTVTTTEFVYDRGRNGGQYETVEHELPDRDWSHDVSVANGGSDLPSNGRWEDASVNRSRGAANSTPVEQEVADAATEADVELLERATFLEQADEAAALTAGAEAAEVAAGLLEVGVDFLAPVAGGAFAAKLAADQFEETEHKVAAGTAAGVATAAVLCTPLGQAGLACYLGYKLVRRGHKFLSKRAAAA